MRLKFVAYAIVAMLFGYCGFWIYISQSSDVYLEKAVESLKNQGVEFSYSGHSVSGFPYQIVLTFSDPEFKFKNGALEADLTASTMDAIAMPWNLKHLILFPQDTDLAVTLQEQQATTVKLTPGSTAISIHNDGHGHYRLSVELQDVALASDAAIDLPTHFTDLAFHLRKQNGPDVTTGLYEPKLLEMALTGSESERFSFLLNTSFLAESVPQMTPAALKEWRDMGGTFEISTLDVTRGDRHITGSGSFTLDPELRPLGVFSTEGATYGDVLDFLEAGHWIDAPQAKAARSVLALLPGGSEEAEVAPLSFTFQDGYLSLGQIRLREIGPVIQVSVPDLP